MSEESFRIPLASETLHVEKRQVLADRVRVKTETKLVEEQVTESLEQSEIEVSRVPIGREVEVAPEVRVEGDTTIVPVLEEILVVEKRLFLKEEVRIKRIKTSETVEMPITLRKQQALVERSNGTPAERDKESDHEL
jgi:uncharacterized protein (TIGR02271 family)